MRPFSIVLALALAADASVAADQRPRDRADWVALAKGGYVLAEGQRAVDLLLEMNALLGATDPVLRDEVAFGAAERWIRDGKLSASELRQLRDVWLANTADGVNTPGDDRVFKRSFSALSLSLIAARDLTTPFLEPAEVQAFFDRMLAYLGAESDVRGFDPVRGWMHSVAHTSDVLKFLARNPKLSSGADTRLLGAVKDKIVASPTVFTWGENDRMALALQSAVRRPDADPAAILAWTEHWVGEHKQLWGGGPHVDAGRFARVENAKQVMRSLHSALSMEARPTPAGDSARQIVLAALARMR
jgi:hypothetical protein